jgi:hypothetical protein
MRQPINGGIIALVFSTALAIASPNAFAAEHGGGGGHGGFGGGERAGFADGDRGGFDGGRFDRGDHADFHGRDFGHFSGVERRLWEGGNWLHDWHGGIFGWWWIVDGEWYYYPEAIYPYPTYVPAASFGEPALNAPAAAPPAQNWYFCDNPQGYYPNIVNCNVPWRAVPTTPAGLQPGAPLAAQSPSG